MKTASFSLPPLAAVLILLALAACSKSGPNAAAAPAVPVTPPAASAPAPGAAIYSVNISPAWTVGQKFGYVADDLTTASDGATGVHFEADGEVLALLPNGNPQKLAYTVKALQIIGADTPPQALFPSPGARIVIEYAANGKRNITFNDKPADPDAADFMEEVLWITERNHPDQEIYGPAAPVAVGASWPVNATAYLDFHEDGDSQYTSVEGSLTLQGIEGDGDNRLGVISGAFTDKGQGAPSNPGRFVDQGKFTASAPLNHVGVFKETESLTTTFTPPTSLLGFLTKSAGPTTTQETIMQKITVR